MGQQMPRPVTSIVAKRSSDSLFRVGFAEMNGWRTNMEDAHVIHMEDTWGFFGVFDGHDGDKCSAFIERRLSEELKAHGQPPDDAATKALMLRLDQEFLDSGQPSGSTGTFVIVIPEESGTFQLRIGNIGDSRILLGRADGTMVEGSGTDGGLTTDHKPNDPSEQERIERTGGTVELKMGVPRVNGDLAVSRAFGDAPYKQTGGPAQEDHPVSAEPEFFTAVASGTDFLMLVCDGISEGSFPNRDVVHLAAEKLRQNGNLDPAEACVAVCRQAIEAGSKDNLSCMIVLFGGGEIKGPSAELFPGPFDAPHHSQFRLAYENMARHVDYSFPQAVELRYDTARRELELAKTQSESAMDVEESIETERLRRKQEEDQITLQDELELFGAGPSESLAGEERTKWFAEWLQEVSSRANDDDGPGGGRFQQGDPFSPGNQCDAEAAPQAAPSGPFAVVQVASYLDLHRAVQDSSALKWDDKLHGVCGKRATVREEDSSDGTSQVQFDPPISLQAWLPTSMLSKLPPVRIVAEPELKAEIEANSDLDWEALNGGVFLMQVCGQVGQAVEEQPAGTTGQGTTLVKFDAPVARSLWLPTSALTDV